MQLDFPIAKEAKMSKYQLFDSVVLLEPVTLFDGAIAPI